MKQLQVIVQDKNTLVLLENGQKGDQINLAELANVDFTAIEEAIKNHKCDCNCGDNGNHEGILGDVEDALNGLV